MRRAPGTCFVGLCQLDMSYVSVTGVCVGLGGSNSVTILVQRVLDHRDPILGEGRKPNDSDRDVDTQSQDF